MMIDFSTREGRRQQGLLVQQAAEQAGLPLEMLAKSIGCSRALIYQYISGATMAQPDRIQQIALRTGKPLIYFYGGEVDGESLHDRMAALNTLLKAQIAPADPESALRTSEQLIALAHQAGDRNVEATLCLKKAALLIDQGEPSTALAVLDKTLSSFRHELPVETLAVAEQNRGHAMLSLGQVDDAETCFQHVAEQPDWSNRWQGTISLAGVAEYRGNYQRALALLDDALALASQAPSQRAGEIVQLYALGNIANVYLACGDFPQALSNAEDAGKLALQLANRDQYLESLLTIGVCQRWLGSLSASCAMLESAGRWARLSADKGREAMALAELAHTLVEMGSFDAARDHAKDALQHGIATSTRRVELSAHLALTTAYLREAWPREAMYHAKQAIEISEHLGQPYAQAVALIALGDTLIVSDAPVDAEQAYAHALRIAERIGARALDIQARIGLLAVTGDGEQSALVAPARVIASPALLWSTLLAWGRHCENRQLLTEAREAYSEAITLISKLRAPLSENAMGDSYLENPAAWKPFLGLARVLSQLDEPQEEIIEMLAQACWPPLTSAWESQ